MILKKVRAMTLNEMLVVVLLTVIVVGLAFTVLGLVQRQMQGIQTDFSTGSTYNRLRQGLWRDFRSAGNITYDPKTGIYQFSTPISYHQYLLDSTHVTRDADTFALRVTEQLRYFDGQPVQGGQIDAVLWRIEAEGRSLELMVYKRNTAENYMNHGF